MLSNTRVAVRKLSTAAAVVAGTLMISSPVIAADNSRSTTTAPVAASVVKDSGAGERVAFSDKLRMYSQRMSSSACTLNAGVSDEESKGYLAVAAHEFNRILNALARGDRALGIVGSEENLRTLSLVKQLQDEWDPMNELVETILASGPTDELINDLAGRNAKLMGHSEVVVSVISGQYSDPTALLLSDAIRLQIAGRQRMLTQKLSSDACLMQNGLPGDSARESFLATIDLFDISLKALREGMPEAGVYASEDAKIQAGLNSVADRWLDLKWPLRAVVAGAKLDPDTRSKVYTGLNELMHEMDSVVISYTKASKLKI